MSSVGCNPGEDVHKGQPDQAQPQCSDDSCPESTSETVVIIALDSACGSSEVEIGSVDGG